MLLRVILPAPIDDDKSTVVADEETQDDTQKLVEQMTTVDSKMEALETKFGAMEDRMKGLESKLDQILALLGSLGGLGSGISAVVAEAAATTTASSEPHVPLDP